MFHPSPLTWILPSPLTETPNFPHVYTVLAAKWLTHFTTYWSLCSYVYCGPASPSYSRPLTWFLYQLDSLVWCSGEDQRKWTLTSVPVITVILFWRTNLYIVCSRSITETHARSVNKFETFHFCFIIPWKILTSFKAFFFSPLFIPSVSFRPLVHVWKVQFNYLKQWHDEKYSNEYPQYHKLLS